MIGIKNTIKGEQSIHEIIISLFVDYTLVTSAVNIDIERTR